MYVVVGENWWYHKGIGTQRPRRVFTLGDVEVFWRRISNGAPRSRRRVAAP